MRVRNLHRQLQTATNDGSRDARAGFSFLNRRTLRYGDASSDRWGKRHLTAADKEAMAVMAETMTYVAIAEQMGVSRWTASRIVNQERNRMNNKVNS
jgi:DNA-binding CsgD family transcriptional regulator